jgi:hypothetical protein
MSSRVDVNVDKRIIEFGKGGSVYVHHWGGVERIICAASYDTSGSMSGSRFEALKRMHKGLLKLFDVTHAYFDHQSYAALHNTPIENKQPGGMTSFASMVGSLKASYDLASRNGGKVDCLVVLTDGKPDPFDDCVEARIKFDRYGIPTDIRIIIICVSSNADRKKMCGMFSSHKNFAFFQCNDSGVTANGGNIEDVLPNELGAMDSITLDNGEVVVVPPAGLYIARERVTNLMIQKSGITCRNNLNIDGLHGIDKCRQMLSVAITGNVPLSTEDINEAIQTLRRIEDADTDKFEELDAEIKTVNDEIEKTTADRREMMISEPERLTKNTLDGRALRKARDKLKKVRATLGASNHISLIQSRDQILGMFTLYGNGQVSEATKRQILEGVTTTTHGQRRNAEKRTDDQLSAVLEVLGTLKNRYPDEYKCYATGENLEALFVGCEVTRNANVFAPDNPVRGVGVEHIDQQCLLAAEYFQRFAEQKKVLASLRGHEDEPAVVNAPAFLVPTDPPYPPVVFRLQNALFCEGLTTYAPTDIWCIYAAQLKIIGEFGDSSHEKELCALACESVRDSVKADPAMRNRLKTSVSGWTNAVDEARRYGIVDGENPASFIPGFSIRGAARVWCELLNTEDDLPETDQGLDGSLEIGRAMALANFQQQRRKGKYVPTRTEFAEQMATIQMQSTNEERAAHFATLFRCDCESNTCTCKQVMCNCETYADTKSCECDIPYLIWKLRMSKLKLNECAADKNVTYSSIMHQPNEDIVKIVHTYFRRAHMKEIHASRRMAAAEFKRTCVDIYVLHVGHVGLPLSYRTETKDMHTRSDLSKLSNCRCTYPKCHMFNKNVGSGHTRKHLRHVESMHLNLQQESFVDADAIKMRWPHLTKYEAYELYVTKLSTDRASRDTVAAGVVGEELEIVNKVFDYHDKPPTTCTLTPMTYKEFEKLMIEHKAIGDNASADQFEVAQAAYVTIYGDNASADQFEVAQAAYE